MTPRERVVAAMNRRVPDRVPVMCQFSFGFMNQQLKDTHISPMEFWMDAEKYAEGLMILRERFNFDGDDDYIEIGQKFTTETEFTVSLWANKREEKAQWIFSNYIGATDRFGILGSGNSFFIFDDINNNGSTTDEAVGIENFEVGKTYWRGSFNHFTPWDFNLADQSDRNPEDQTDPETTENEEDEKNDELACTGSYVKPYQQSFHEDIPITGTDLTLHYSSQRTEGYQHKINFKLLGDTISAGLQEVVAKLEIGGRVFEQSFISLSTGLEAEFYWDGTDIKGNRIKGEALGLISIGYRYQSEYS
ncbi:hypothetical protein LCGC14_3049430, partial [marine sediment metagenome]